MPKIVQKCDEDHDLETDGKRSQMQLHILWRWMVAMIQIKKNMDARYLHP